MKIELSFYDLRTLCRYRSISYLCEEPTNCYNLNRCSPMTCPILISFNTKNKNSVIAESDIKIKVSK